MEVQFCCLCLAVLVQPDDLVFKNMPAGNSSILSVRMFLSTVCILKTCSWILVTVCHWAGLLVDMMETMLQACISPPGCCWFCPSFCIIWKVCSLKGKKYVYISVPFIKDVLSFNLIRCFPWMFSVLEGTLNATFHFGMVGNWYHFCVLTCNLGVVKVM